MISQRLFDLWWDAEQELHKRALAQIRALIQTYLEDNAYKENCRIELVRDRIKTRRSILKKSVSDDIADSKVLLELTDISGLRIICHNNRDVYKVFNLIQKIAEDHHALNITPGSVEDYIKTPKGSGYRSFQFIVEYSVRYGDTERRLPCEIQIRTVTQDAWATLSHADFYKREEDIPKSLKAIMRQLADQLEGLNNITEVLREEAEKQIETADITEDTLYTFLSQNYEYKSDRYYLKLHLTNLEQLGITKIREVKEILENPELREKIGQIIVEAGGPEPQPSDRSWKAPVGQVFMPYVGLILFFGAAYSKRGESSALQEAKEFFANFKEAFATIVQGSEELQKLSLKAKSQ